MNVDRRALYSALQELIRVTDPKASLAVLSHVLLRAVADVLTITATDLKQTLSCRLHVDGDIETCLPAKLLMALVKPEGRGDAGDVDIELTDTGACSIIVEGLTSRIAAMDSDEFPSQSEREWAFQALWPSKGLGEALAYVLPAASTDDGRPHLNCVSFEADRMVTTDGHRLHVANLPSCLNQPRLIRLDTARTLTRILKLGEHAVIAAADDYVRIGVGPWQLTSKLVDARFPPYEKVVPSRDDRTSIQIESHIFSRALARIVRLSKNKPVRLCINGAVTITASDPEFGDAEVEVPVVDSNHVGDDLVIGVTPAYLRDAVAGDGPLEMSFAGPTDAIRLDLAEDRLAVVMPMRL